MSAFDAALHYKPHTTVEPLVLPELPLQLSPSLRKKGILSRWLLGPSSTPVSYLDPEQMTAYTERWQIKWNYYEQTFPKETLEAVQRMTEADIKVRAGWLENDLKRVQDALATMDIPNEDPEIYSGMTFVGTLIDEMRPYFQRLLSLGSSASDEALKKCREELQKIERVWGFVIETHSKILSIRDLSVMRSIKFRSKRTSSPEDLTNNSTSQRLRLSLPASLNSMTLQSADNRVELQMSNLSNHAAVDDEHLEARQHQSGADVQTAGVSSVSSHRTNLAALLAIAFFGASVAWSTLFSGTRGNLVIISWAASVFIVGCTAAASASLLVETDESIMTKYMRVRWTVRVLTLVSAAHVFAGVILVSIAIAVLDPNASAPLSGKRRASSDGVKAAGCYAVGMAVVVVITMITVRRRYTQRTWFK